jgi:hypothetical protein
VIIHKYREKRKKRNWKKQVRYTCRKNLADRRIRIRGRFVKLEDMPKDYVMDASSSSHPHHHRDMMEEDDHHDEEHDYEDEEEEEEEEEGGEQQGRRRRSDSMTSTLSLTFHPKFRNSNSISKPSHPVPPFVHNQPVHNNHTTDNNNNNGSITNSVVVPDHSSNTSNSKTGLFIVPPASLKTGTSPATVPNSSSGLLNIQIRSPHSPASSKEASELTINLFQMRNKRDLYQQAVKNYSAHHPHNPSPNLDVLKDHSERLPSHDNSNSNGQLSASLMNELNDRFAEKAKQNGDHHHDEEEDHDDNDDMPAGKRFRRHSIAY